MDRQTLLKNLLPAADEALNLALECLGDLSDVQRNWKPAPQRWSVNQCLEHINITNRHWLKNFQPTLEQGVKSDNTADFNHSMIGGFMIRSILPGKKSSFKTKKSFNPPSQLDNEKVWNDFTSLQKEWINLMHKIQPYDISKNRVSSPFFFYIRYKIGDALVLNNIHTLRHLNQAVNVTKEAAFPKS